MGVVSPVRITSARPPFPEHTNSPQANPIPTQSIRSLRRDPRSRSSSASQAREQFSRLLKAQEAVSRLRKGEEQVTRRRKAQERFRVAMAALMSSLAALTLTPLTAPSRSSSSSSHGASLLRIECSSHPQKKATAHHNKSRPKKTNPYDKNRRGPTVYKRLPKPPPIWGFDTSDLDISASAAVSEEEAPVASDA